MASLDIAYGDHRYVPGPDVVGDARGLVINVIYEVKYDGRDYYREDGVQLPRNIREIAQKGEGYLKGLHDGFYYSFFQ